MKIRSQDQIIQESINETDSNDPMVHICWLIAGLDLWHTSNGKMGHSLKDTQRYVLSNIYKALEDEMEGYYLRPYPYDDGKDGNYIEAVPLSKIKQLCGIEGESE